MKRLTWLMLGLGATYTVAHAQANLTLADRAMVDQTLAAIDRGDFQAADACFQNSYFRANSAAIRKSLGEAEARISGRELRAIVWLASSLADDPRRPDAAAVRAQINALDATSRKRIATLIQSYEDAARALPPATHDETLREVAPLWAAIGDDDRALKTIGSIRDDGPKSDALSYLIELQTTRVEIQWGGISIAETRARLESARKLAESIPLVNDRADPLYHVAYGYLSIAQRQMRAGDFAAAQASIATTQEMVPSLGQEDGPEAMDGIATTEIGLARAQLARGDARSARATLIQAEKAAEAIRRPNEKFDLFQDLADAQMKAGDLPGARRSLVEALPAASIYNDPSRARLTIARAQVQAGDVAGARQSMARATGRPAKDVNVSAAIAQTWPKQEWFQSEALASGLVVNADQWWFVLSGLNKPWFTAYRDFSDYRTMGLQIEKTPVENGQQWAYRPDDNLYALRMVCNAEANAQKTVDGLLHLQFAR